MLTRDDLKTLQQVKGEALVSIIAPMHKTFPDTDKNPIILKDLIKETERRLKENYDPVRVENLMAKIEDLRRTIDFNDTDEGLALFVSEDTAKLVKLPFQPKEHVSVGKTFQTRDLFYALRANPQYLLLSLSAQNVRLFRGTDGNIREIKNGFFPAHYEGPARTEPQSNLRRVDEEYEELEDMRIFLRQVEENLYEVAGTGKVPVFLTGEAEYVSFIKNIERTGRLVKGEMHGNLAHAGSKEIASRVRPVIEQYFLEEKIKLMDQLKEMPGYGKYAGGVQDVWKAAKLGQVMTLLVETNYSLPAHVRTDDELTLELGTNIPRGEANHHDDIVDDIIEIITEMNGEVVFVEDGSLAEHGHIAAILRYSL